MPKRHVRAASKLQLLHVPRTGFTLFRYGALGLSSAMDDLVAMNTVRNRLTHGESELAEALNRLGIELTDYAKAWDR